jgi:hypothetical protein
MLIALLFLVSSVVAFGQTALTVVQVSETATLLADNSADTGSGNRIANPNGDVVLVLRNTHGSNASTVTITAQGASVSVPGYGPMAKANLAVSLAAGEIKHVGPFPKRAWNNSSGQIVITTTGTGTVKISPVRVVLP